MAQMITVVLAMLLGFLAGLLSFKVKSRWCAECGTVKSCPRCADRTEPLAVQWPCESVTTAERPRNAGPGWGCKRGTDEYQWEGR
jgi:hypothetical protein